MGEGRVWFWNDIQTSNLTFRILMNYDVEQNINMSLCMHIIYDDIMRLFLRERERERERENEVAFTIKMHDECLSLIIASACCEISFY